MNDAAVRTIITDAYTEANFNAAISGKVFDGAAFAVSGGVDLLNSTAGVTLYSRQGRITLSGALPSFSLIAGMEGG